MRRSIADQFVEVCRAITSDGRVSGEEIWFIGKWLNDNPRALKTWPGSLLLEPLNRFFADGHIDESELQEAAKLLLQIEAEWAAKKEGKASGSAEKIKSLPMPPVRALAWDEIALPPLDWAGQVESFTSNDVYFIDLKNHTCDCPDWVEMRRGFPPRHPARACKHVVCALCEKATVVPIQIQGPLYPLLQNAFERKGGIRPGQTYGWCDYAGVSILFSADANQPWVNLLVPQDDSFQQYGYHTGESRWSYGAKPENHRVLAKVAQSFSAGLH